MKSADMSEVFKRLGEKAAKFLDESHQEMPFKPTNIHDGKEPLFLCRGGVDAVGNG